MFTAKGKERVFSPTGSIIAAAIVIFPIQVKDIYLRVEAPDIFIDDRKKFKAYEAQYRMYLWADAKREDWRNLKIISE